jgi:hypothetical protein
LYRADRSRERSSSRSEEQEGLDRRFYMTNVIIDTIQKSFIIEYIMISTVILLSFICDLYLDNSVVKIISRLLLGTLLSSVVYNIITKINSYNINDNKMANDVNVDLSSQECMSELGLNDEMIIPDQCEDEDVTFISSN